jgi:hypothetical protein
VQPWQNRRDLGSVFVGIRLEIDRDRVVVEEKLLRRGVYMTVDLPEFPIALGSKIFGCEWW